MNMTSPESVANSRSRNQAATSFRRAMNATETPSPTSARPAAARPSDAARPNRIDPAPATTPPSVTIRRGPRRSTRMPVGICMSVYAPKYVAASAPSSAPLAPNAARSSPAIADGAMRWKKERTYAPATRTKAVQRRRRMRARTSRSFGVGATGTALCTRPLPARTGPSARRAPRGGAAAPPGGLRAVPGQAR